MSENAHFSRQQFKFSILAISLAMIFLFPFSLFAEVNADTLRHPDEQGEEGSNTEILRQQSAQNDEESESDSVQPLSAVTVIGSRLPSFKVPFADVPANVSYIPANVTREEGKEIYVDEPRSVQESVKDLESVVLFDQVGNGIDTTFSLRGFNESSAVVVLLDGVRVNELDSASVNFPLISFDDIESIQVDRGSASPLFGSNAFAGVVHLTTGRPSDKPVSLFGGYEYSSFGGNRFYQGISGTLQDKITPLEGAFKYYFRGGRHLNNGYREDGDYRITNFDIKTSYELPDDQGRFFVNVKHIDDAVSNPGALNFQQFQDDDQQTLTPLDGRYMKSTIVSLGADKAFWDNKILASVLASNRTNNVDFFTTFQTFGTGIAGVPFTQLVEIKSRATDFIWQLAYQDQWTDWLHNQSLIGMEMRDASEHVLRRNAFLGIANTNPGAAITDRSSSPKSVGLFWRETLNFNNVVILHGGMRHDWHWLDTLNQLTDTELTNRWQNSTMSLGVTVRPVQSVDLFANYSEGFRVPSISELASFTGTITSLNPERSDSYEVGGRVRIKDNTQIKMSYFLIDVLDEIVFDSSTVSAQFPFGRNVNAGETRRTGIEIRVDTKPIEEVEAYASYTWTDAWIRETNPSGSVVDGRNIGQIPEHRWTLGVTTRPLVRVCDEFCQGLKIGLYGTFTGKQHPQAYETDTQADLNATGGAGHFIKPYSVWDFILSYELKGQEIYFKLNNIFDERYYSRAITANVFAATPIQEAGRYTFVNPAPGREFLFGTRWEFDQLGDLFSSAKA